MEYLRIHTDGASRGNPGPSSIGYVFFAPDTTQIYTYKARIGNSTNNIAEYTAVINALSYAVELQPKKLEVYMDSELLCKQLRGEYKVKAPHLKPLFDQIKEIEKRLSSVTYFHVPRSHPLQKIADRLCNEALDEPVQ